VISIEFSELGHPKKLPEDQIEAASKVLGRAFQDDPLFVYCFPDPIERKIKSAIHCEFLILLGILSGEVYITSSNIEGVAVWHPHGIKDQIMGKQSKEIIRRLRKIKRGEFSDFLYIERMGIFEEFANSFQNEHVNFPHWYLEQNLSCYLHTENERNIKFYEHFGFKLIGKNKVPNSDFYHHAMLRNRKKKGK